ncbi:MAG: hypothetical protein DSY42_05130 [Aquifex sp.]|nr:MAG: hypothetical protein DSY42_05130 [Aquifex sp.]
MKFYILICPNCRAVDIVQEGESFQIIESAYEEKKSYKFVPEEDCARRILIPEESYSDVYTVCTFCYSDFFNAVNILEDCIVVYDSDSRIPYYMNNITPTVDALFVIDLLNIYKDEINTEESLVKQTLEELLRKEVFGMYRLVKRPFTHVVHDLLIVLKERNKLNKTYMNGIKDLLRAVILYEGESSISKTTEISSGVEVLKDIVAMILKDTEVMTDAAFTNYKEFLTFLLQVLEKKGFYTLEDIEVFRMYERV